MNYKELDQVLANLAQAISTLEDLYIEGEGEVTEETEQMEDHNRCQFRQRSPFWSFLQSWQKRKC